MINGFEEFTHELDEYELNTLLPVFIQGLAKKKGVVNAVTSATIIKQLKQKRDTSGKQYKISGARVRKLVNHIRVNNLIPGLVATGKGYYISENPVEILRYVDSLKARAGAINQVADSYKPYLQNLIRQDAA